MAGSTVQQNQIPNEPELRDLLNLFKKEILLNFNCHHIGTIQVFNPANQTASVTINYKKTYFLPDPITGVYTSQLVDYPILLDCPVVCLGGGTTSLTFPIESGDECLVLFNDRDLDNWFAGNGNGPVATPRLHSVSDGIIIVGIRSLANVIESYDGTRALLSNGLTQVGVGVTLVRIANATFTLNGLLQNLMTQLSSLVTAIEAITVSGVTPGSGVSGPVVNLASFVPIATQLTTIATELGELLE